MRGVAAVLAGLGLMAFSQSIVVENVIAATVGVVGLAAAAGFLTAWIAGRNEFRYAGALGIGMVAVAVIAMRSHGSSRPGWYEVAVGGCGPMAAFFGAGLRMLMKTGRSRV